MAVLKTAMDRSARCGITLVQIMGGFQTVVDTALRMAAAWSCSMECTHIHAMMTMAKVNTIPIFYEIISIQDSHLEKFGTS